MVCFATKGKAKSAARARRHSGKKAHIKKAGKGHWCMVKGGKRKSKR